MKGLFPAINKAWDKVLKQNGKSYEGSDRDTRLPHVDQFMAELERINPNLKGNLTEKDYDRLECENYHSENGMFIKHRWFEIKFCEERERAARIWKAKHAKFEGEFYKNLK